MNKLTINPNRLQWCCDTIGINLDFLSNEIKIANQTLEKVMDNEAVLSVNQLSKIAQFFNRKLLFFLEPENVKEEKIYSPQFRTINNQKPLLSPKIRALIERIESQRKTYINLLEELGQEIANDWYPRHLDLNNKSIKETAEQARHWLKLGNPISFTELRNTVEVKGIMVVVTNGYNGKWQISKENPVRGFSLYYETLPIIVVKKQASKGAQAFTLMHELAHLLLHKASIIDEEKDFFNYKGKEREANVFAGNILVPDNFLLQINVDALLRLNVEEYDPFLRPFKKLWCVSTDVILIRLVRNKKLSQDNYNDYREYKEKEKFPVTEGTRLYRYREPINIFGKPFVNTVLDAYHNNIITLAKTSTFLDNIKISDIHKLEGRDV